MHLPEMLFSNAAHHITQREVWRLLHPFLPLTLQEILRQELDRPKALNAMK
ncbi:hypothetical protein D3C71_2149370 [compost metagenome]